MFKSSSPVELSATEPISISISSDRSLALPSALDPALKGTLERMFRDPRVLEPEQRKVLVAGLREAVDLAPHVPEVRVLYGMALCVDVQPQEAMEELRIASEQAPDSFIAQLKYGELLMRMRICERAAEYTHRAAQLAGNPVQSELARRQAATIRTMQREGIERGGYRGLLPRALRFFKKSSEKTTAPVLVGSK